MNIIHKFLTQNDIESITKDSNIALLNALYQCDNIIEVNKHNNAMFSDDELMSFYNYHSSFYLSFVANKKFLSNSYLTSRKALYKSIMQIKKEKAEAQKQEIDSINIELKDLDFAQRESKLNEIQRKQKARKSQNSFYKNNAHSTKDFILQTNDKTRTVIFLASNGLTLKTNANYSLDSKLSLSKLIHIHNNKIDIFTKHNTTVDIYELAKNYGKYGINLDLLHSANTQIFLYSILLNGGTESTLPHNECFFESLNLNENSSFNAINSNNNLNFNVLNSSDLNSSKAYSNNDLDESKPIYYLEYDEFDLNSRDSSKSLNSNNSTQILQVFLNKHKLTILNYSILNSSLNIKLECKSKEANKIKENEINQQKELEFKKNNINLSSTALLCPILECDELRCIHGGRVLLKSNLGKSIKAKLKDDSIKDAPIMLESDLLYSPILNCPNSIAGIANPCTQIALILPSARGLKKYNNDYPIMQDLCMSGVFSDKGFPVICTKQENTLKIQAAKMTNSKIKFKEDLEAHIDFSLPSLAIITAFDGLDEFYFTPSAYEDRKANVIANKFYKTDEFLDINFEAISKDDSLNDLNANNALKSMLESLTQLYDKAHFTYRIFSIRVAYSIYEYILIIPKKMPKFIAKMLKEKRNKAEIKYGYGRFIDLQKDYVRGIDESKEKEVRLNIQGKILLAPSGMQSLRVVVR